VEDRRRGKCKGFQPHKYAHPHKPTHAHAYAGLVFAVLIGIVIPVVGYNVGRGGHVAIFCVVALFFIAGLKLKTDEAKAALSSYKTTAAGITSILCLTCAVGSGLTIALPMESADLKLGMIIFFCMPCTINRWTRRVRADCCQDCDRGARAARAGRERQRARALKCLNLPPHTPPP
jgi:hypothetical protein